MVTIAASHAWAVSTLRWRSWMCHLLTVDAHLGVAARLRYLDKGVELLPPSRSSSRPGFRQARSTSGGSTAGLRITVVANPEVTIAPLALRNQMSCQWNVLGPLKGAYQQYPWHSSRWPDVDRCIGGLAGASGEEDSSPELVPRADAPRDGPSLADSSEEGSTDLETGHLVPPVSRPLETSCLVPGRDAEVLGDLPQKVPPLPQNTITSARAPSTRHAYAFKWNLFVEWCSFHREDPRRCPIRVVLSFLQQGLEQRLSPSTLKVYVAAIAANHDPVERKSVGKHDWVVRFLRGTRRLNPP